MEASFFSKPLSQSECRIKITSQLLSESECWNLGHDLTKKPRQTRWQKCDTMLTSITCFYISIGCYGILDR